MAIHLSNIIESILNPNSRFRTLDGIYGVRDKDGEPAMTLGELTADFDTVWNGGEYTLRCFLRPDGGRNDELREISVYTSNIECGFLLPHLYLDGEMLVFDTADDPVWIDVMLQQKPGGQRLDRYLSEIADTGDSEAIHALTDKLAGIAEWLTNNDFSHRNICSRHIYVSPGEGLKLVNYSRGSRKRSHDDLLSIGALTAALYIAACQPELYREIVHDKTLKVSGLRKLTATIADLMDQEDAEALKDLLAFVSAGSEASGENLCRAIRRVASTLPRSYETLEKIAEQLRSRNAAKGKAAERGKYSFIGMMHDMVMRVFDGTEWSYVDRHGERAFPGSFVGAGDFSEGRAVVETTDGYGLIGLDGRFLIEPQCDDIEWDSINNVAIVTVDGQSGLYGREGQPLTGLIYDQILSGGEGLFPVRKNGKYGYIGRDGMMAIRPQFDDAFGFRNGFARVAIGNHEFLIDATGKQIDNIREKTTIEEPVGL